jgi:hypothetical protein
VRGGQGDGVALIEGEIAMGIFGKFHGEYRLSIATGGDVLRGVVKRDVGNGPAVFEPSGKPDLGSELRDASSAMACSERGTSGAMMRAIYLMNSDLSILSGRLW